VSDRDRRKARQDGARLLAIDGKTLRRSFDRAAGKSAPHVVTAFAAGAKIAVGRVAVEDKSNEIIAARRLLGPFDLTGVLVTGDASHRQGETAGLIQERGGKWLFTPKANRPSQLAEVETWFADPANKPHGAMPVAADVTTMCRGCSPIAAIPMRRRCPAWP